MFNWLFNLFRKKPRKLTEEFNLTSNEVTILVCGLGAIMSTTGVYAPVSELIKLYESGKLSGRQLEKVRWQLDGVDLAHYPTSSIWLICRLTNTVSNKAYLRNSTAFFEIDKLWREGKIPGMPKLLFTERDNPNLSSIRGTLELVPEFEVYS